MGGRLKDIVQETGEEYKLKLANVTVASIPQVQEKFPKQTEEITDKFNRQNNTEIDLKNPASIGRYSNETINKFNASLAHGISEYKDIFKANAGADFERLWAPIEKQLEVIRQQEDQFAQQQVLNEKESIRIMNFSGKSAKEKVREGQKFVDETSAKAREEYAQSKLQALEQPKRQRKEFVKKGNL